MPASGALSYDSGRNYHYSDGDSQDTFIKNNAFGKESGYGFTNFLNPVQGVASGIRGKGVYKRQRAEYEQQQLKYGQDLQARDAENYQIAQGYRQNEQDRQRDTNLAQLDAAFGSGDRQKARQDQYDASIGASLATLGKRASDTNRENALALARRGVLGGSEDAEKQAATSADYQSGVVDATTRAQQRQQQLNQADADQYHALRASILSGNPEDAAQTLAQTQRLTSDAEHENQLYDFGAAHHAIGAQGANNTSQLLGGIGQAGADAYYTYEGVTPQQRQQSQRYSYQGD